jgi:malate dehydrogenase (oxaloacetate-decarboxylating)(NADP+)
LDKYRNNYCTFNDDIQGTASVAVAGILASLRVTKTKLEDNVFLFQGAGEANLGIAGLLVNAMEEHGIDTESARNKIWLVDSKGLVTKGRSSGGITGHKEHYVKDVPACPTLEAAVEIVKPTILVGEFVT